MDTNLPKLLERLGYLTNKKHPQLNSGGCCVYASRVAANLKQLKLRPRIIVAGIYQINRNEDIRTLRDGHRHLTLKEWNDRSVFFSHVFVEFSWRDQQWLHDSDNTVIRARDQGYLGNWYFYDGYLTVGEALLLAADAAGWNEQFDRAQVPQVHAGIDRFFKNKIFAKSVDSTLS